VARKRDFLEIQVWRRGGEAGNSHLYFDEPSSSPEKLSAKSREDPILADKMGLKQSTPYITISSKKSLRVKDLYLVAILKIGERIYFQLNVCFPQAPSTKKPNQRTQGQTPRTSSSPVRI
jgi:hypothetical protein